MNKYYQENNYLEEFGFLEDYSTFILLSQDSYNEQLIGEAIKSTGQVTELKIATINLAVVGFGNRKYGSVKIGNDTIEIQELLKTCNVLMNNPSNANLSDNTLTPNRLCRFFRYEIKKFLETTKVSTYLYRKYSSHDESMFSICFRGSEYLELTEQEEKYLLNVYQTMDASLGTRIQDRVLRVFQAKRGIIAKIQ